MDKKEDEYSEEEATRRFHAAIRRAVTTPHKSKDDVKTPGPRGEAQRQRRAKARRKS